MKLALFLIASIALADPVAVTWSGAPTVLSQQCWGCEYGPVAPGQEAYQIDNGLNAQESITFGSNAISPNPGSSNTVETPFTIASPADINLNVNAYWDAAGTSCGDSGCNYNLSAWDLDGGFSGSVSIIGANEIVAGMVEFGASGSQAGLCYAGLQCSVGYSSSGLTLNTGGSFDAFLQAGTYELLTIYSDWNSSEGDSEALGNIVETVSDPPINEVPINEVPEPSMLGAIIATVVATGALIFVHERLRKM